MRCDSETETCIKRDNFTRADITIRAVMNMISHVGSRPGNGKAGLRVSIQLSCQLQLVTDSVWLGAPLHHTVRNRSFTGYRPAYDINLIPLIHAGHYTKYPPPSPHCITRQSLRSQWDGVTLTLPNWIRWFVETKTEFWFLLLTAAHFHQDRRELIKWMTKLTGNKEEEEEEEIHNDMIHILSCSW